MVVVCVERNRNRVNERLVLSLTVACGDGDGLSMGLGDELGGSDIRNPNLHRAQPLAAETFPMLAHAIAG
ncbi:MAG: hypothetical protein QOF83_2928 [Solirubrobacteraceae bacterium]|nr:hypothetical protein [Solirubrobacteraceae bacterium]